VGILTRLARPRAETASEALMRAIRGGGAVTKSGARVTEDTALSVADVFKCVRVISEDIAKLPLILYRRLPNGGKERATDHPLYALLDVQPNLEQTAFEFREMMQIGLEVRGNGYAFKNVVRGQVRELLPLKPAEVTVRRLDNWRNEYTWRGKDYSRKDILHIAGMSADGVFGLSLTREQRETIGLAVATLEHGAKLFGNAARPGGVLEVPTELSDTAYSRLKESWETAHGGENMHRTALLEGGTKWSQVGMDNEKAQYLETRQFQRAEIAGLFRIPPHKIGDLLRSTNNNIEHQSQEYIDDALMPRLRRWEQRLTVDLLTPEERKTLFFEFLPEALLKGDIKSRYAAYQSAINTGWMSPNEARVRENLNPEEGLDEFRRPLNMETAGDPALREAEESNAKPDA
jgi:HK97 family phage portal protein